jgi:serine/threonine protein kinase
MEDIRVDAPSKLRNEQLKIGRFIVRRWLGSGLQGKVFQAYDPVLERQVAIKWLNPSGSDKTSANCEPYASEARMVAKLEHPNIVPLHEAGVYRGFQYLVFSYVEGTTLRDKRLQGGAMPVQQALITFGAILDGVACAHAHGILHLDLSPGNIMIDTAGVPHIMDFGLAKLAGADAAGLNDDGPIGTPQYMSPEHFNSRPLTARSDIFALGLILYEMVAGRHPVQAENLQVLINAIAERELDLGDMDRIGLDARLQAVIRRALSHDADRRYADAAEMKLAVDELLGPDGRGTDHSTVKFLLNRMQRKANFPALSNNLLEVNRLTNENSDSSVHTLARVVLRDYAITNKLLKLANSSIYRRAGLGIKTVSDAIRLLGMKVIRMACNSLAYFDAMKGGDRYLKDALISCFVSAVIGRHFAIRLGRQDLAEEAFICGMFHRLGKSLSIFYFEEEFREIERLVVENGLTDEAASVRVLGIGYGDLGMAVAARWKLPKTIQGSIKCLGPGHVAKPASLVETQQQIAAFANELCELAARAPADQGLLRLNEFSARFAGLFAISTAALVELLQSAFEKLEEFAPVLGLELPGSRFVSRVGEFLAAMQVPAAPVHQMTTLSGPGLEMPKS